MGTREADLFEKSGALLQGHFQLTSGKHSDRYFQCALVLQYPEYCGELCGAIVKHFSGEIINVVLAPAVGGIVVAQETGRQLDVRSLFAERRDGRLTLRRGFRLNPGERVLVVEDVVTTGGSVLEVMELVRAAGARLVGVGAIVDRSGGKVDFGVPFYAARIQEVTTWEPEECPLCKKGIPIEKPGSRHLSA